MDIESLKRELIALKSSAYDEGFLDNRFKQFEQQRRTTNNPELICDIVNDFIFHNRGLLKNLDTILGEENVDFKMLRTKMHDYAEECSKLGAARLRDVCREFIANCQEENIIQCLENLPKVKFAYGLLRDILDRILELEKQILAAGGSIPYWE